MRDKILQIMNTKQEEINELKRLKKEEELRLAMMTKNTEIDQKAVSHINY